MTQFVFLHIGGAGINIGLQFWETLIDFHNLKHDDFELPTDSKYHLDKFFDDLEGRIRIRALFIDGNSECLNKVKKSRISEFIDKNQIIFVYVEDPRGVSGEAAYFGNTDVWKDMVRKITDFSNTGYQQTCYSIFFSVIGGFGAGFVSGFLYNFLQNDQDRIITFSIMPSHNTPNKPFETYNFATSIRNLADKAHLGVMYDNESLAEIAQTKFEIQDPLYKDLNRIMIYSLFGFYTPLYVKDNSIELEKYLTAIVPYPRIHFLIPGFVSLKQDSDTKLPETEVISKLANELYTEVNEEKLKRYPNFLYKITKLSSCHYDERDYYNIFNIFTETPVDKSNLYQNYESILAPLKSWEPKGKRLSNLPSDDFTNIFNESLPGMSGTVLWGFKSSKTHITNFSALASKFDQIFYKRAWVVHWVCTGGEEGEFTEWREDLAAIIMDHQEGGCGCGDLEEGGEE